MPAGSTFSPLRLPEGFSLLGFLPQCEIHLIPFFSLFLLSLSFGAFKPLQLAIAKLLLELLNVEVHGAIGHICIAIVDDLLDEDYDFLDVLGHTGDDLRRFNIEDPA
jgi:hypothetical protein